MNYALEIIPSKATSTWKICPHFTQSTDKYSADSQSQQLSTQYKENTAIKKPLSYRTQLADRFKETMKILRKWQLLWAWKMLRDKVSCKWCTRRGSRESLPENSQRWKQGGKSLL